MNNNNKGGTLRFKGNIKGKDTKISNNSKGI